MIRPNFILLGFLGWMIILQSWVSAQVPYDRLNTSGLGVDMSKVSMDPAGREELASALGNQVRNSRCFMNDSALITPKILGLGLLLSPSNKATVVVCTQLAQGVVPNFTDDVMNPPDLSKKLGSIAQSLVRAGGKDNSRLAIYLLDVAMLLDSRNEDAAYENGLLKKQYGVPDWNALNDPQVQSEQGARKADFSAPVPPSGRVEFKPGLNPDYAARNKGLVKRQASIKGLFVTTLANGMSAGSAIDIIASVYNNPNPNQTDWRPAQAVGEEMLTSMQEAIHAAQVRYPNWEPGNTISFSFGEKYSPKDGGSAGLAFTVLLFNLLDGINLDPKFALTGDVTVDWKVRKIGMVGEKIRGAMLDKADYVLIPEENIQDLNDVVLVYSPSALWTIQIFSAGTVDAAVDLLRTDRKSDYQKGIEKFSQIQKNFAQRGVTFLYDPKAGEALKEVIQWIPSHQSARALLLMKEGKLSKTLSVGASLEQSFLPCIFILDAIAGESRGNSGEVTAEMCMASLKKLNANRTMINPKVLPIHTALVDYLKATQALYEANHPGDKRGRIMGEKVAKCLESQKIASRKFREETSKISQDRSVVEGLIR